MTDQPHSRRSFLAGTGGALAAAWATAQWPLVAAAHGHATQMAGADGPPVLAYLDADDARLIDALAACIVPTDDTPGAREAGAVYFIDRSLRTWAAGAAAEFGAGLATFRADFGATHGQGFADVDEATRISYLETVERTPFFGAVRFLTLLGMFALPSYGGNRDGIGWKLIGFEDTHAFTPPFGHYDRDYPGFVVPVRAP